MNPEDNNAQWNYKPDAEPAADELGKPSTTDNLELNNQPPADSGSLSWTANEYIEHDRNIMWYMALFGLAGLVSAVVYLLTKDYFAVGTIVAIAVIVAFAAGRKPRQVECQITSSGIKVGSKAYGFSQFKSFGIVRQDGHASIELLPIKRFMPMVSAYFDPADEDKIVEALGGRLPYQERQLAGIDKLSHRLKF